jgi:hypothetical protein
MEWYMCKLSYGFWHEFFLLSNLVCLYSFLGFRLAHLLLSLENSFKFVLILFFIHMESNTMESLDH